MTVIRDPTIKIFGATIPLHEERIIRIDSGERSDHSSIIDAIDDKEECGESFKAEVQNEIHMQCGLEDASYKNETNEDCCLSEHNNELDTESAKKEANQTAADSVQGNKTLKKPDKLLPCPRCNSLDTKFCYFNNYNVNQPRHFCKKCQRYWTDGGTMRNVPVGAGRRKSKHSSHYRPDGVPPTHIDTRNSPTHHHQKISVISKSGDGTILQFGQDGILCETVTSARNLKNENRNMDHLNPVTCPKNVDQSSHVSYSSSTTHQEMKESPQKEDDSRNSTGPPLQFYAGPSWALPWNPMWGTTAPIASPASSEVVCGSDNNNINPLQWGIPSIVAVPPFCATNMPIPIMPTAYWSCMPGWIPWAAEPNGNHSLSSPTSNKVLGKRHSRDGSENVPDDNDEEVKKEKPIWIPKSIRMDDADEALKSCIWDTLGINHDQKEQTSRSGGGMFKAFQLKTGVKSSTSVSNQVLLANPAALARSQTFQESN